mgnify:CR=1 FL=1
MKAVVYGEIIWDIYPDEYVIGGAPFNFSAHLSHLGNEVYLLSAVGRDKLGEDAMLHLKKHGVRGDLIQSNGFPTGACIVTLDENKIPHYEVKTNVAYDHIAADDGLIEKIKSLDADVFYFNTLIQRSECSKNTLFAILDSCSFGEIFCDINIRENCYDKESVLLCLSKCTILKISEEEAHFLWDLGITGRPQDGKSFTYAIAEAYPNIKYIAYTLGKKGSEVLDTRTGQLYYSGKPEDVPVVSTVGAGDCYGAAICDGIMSGKSIPDTIKIATERSSIVVSHKEAIPF